MPHDRRDIAKKRFGQHFLTDKNLLDKIVRTAEVRPDDVVIEIGPGRGALTEALLKTGARVVAVEKDKGLANELDKKFSDAGRFTLITEDVLKVSFKGLAEEHGNGLKSVSNLPYNISTPVLFKFLEERSSFTRIVIMLQKEVAERLASTPGTKDYGILSVFFNLYFDVKKEFSVSRNLFVPRPKVDSAVLSLHVLTTPRAPVPDWEVFKRVVKAAFSTRRKTLKNALSTLGLEKGLILKALEGAGVDPGRRAETLSIDEFSSLARALYPFGKNA
jgi:16S rRNA (adenine1518-N6/adenine1519-N6)-dimethyltransferase